MRSPGLTTRRKIGAVQRAVDILNLFDSERPELGTTEISQALALHKSTVSTLVATLAANGYLDQNPSTRKYVLGLRLLERSSVLLGQMDIRRVARPHLDKLHDWRGESVNMGIRDGYEVVYIEQLPSDHSTGMREEIGKRAPLHSTALGKSLIAWLPPAELQRIVKGCELISLTPRTITGADQFALELEKTRERGYGLDNEEHQLGGRCVGAPIFDHLGQPIAAVSVSTPLARIPMSEVPVVAEMVRETAKAISLSLGYVQKPY